MDCIFCKIAKQEIPANLVLENDQVVAFPDLHPQAPVHLLIIPKTHYSHLGGVPEGELGILQAMLSAARQLAKKNGISERGYRLVMNVLPEGGQSVFHVHMHLLAGRQMGPSLIG